MKLHILSDLHLGFATMDHPRNDADMVILAGDIARPAQAVEWARAWDKPVPVSYTHLPLPTSDLV